MYLPTTLLTSLTLLPTLSLALPSNHHQPQQPLLSESSLLTPQTHLPKYTHHHRPTSAEAIAVLEDAGIIPTVLNIFHASFLINATWGPHASAALGNTLVPSKLGGKPVVTLVEPRGEKEDDDKDDDKEKGKASTVVPLNNLVITLTDPDAPSRDNPKNSEFCHWIAVGVPLNLSDTSISTNSDRTLQPFVDIMSYTPPAPPAKTGKHRYVFTAWMPLNATVMPLDLVAPEGRAKWGGYGGVRDWAQEMGLVAIGANFVYAKHEKE